MLESFSSPESSEAVPSPQINLSLHLPSIRSPHLYDKRIVELGITLVSTLRLILAEEDCSFTPWELSDTLEYCDLLLHCSINDKLWNTDILLLGISFAQKVLTSPHPSKEREAAAKDTQDFFRVSWTTFQENPRKAKKLLLILKGGWWQRGKSIEDIGRDVLAEGKFTAWSEWLGRKQAEQGLLVPMQRSVSLPRQAIAPEEESRRKSMMERTCNGTSINSSFESSMLESKEIRFAENDMMWTGMVTVTMPPNSWTKGARGAHMPNSSYSTAFSQNSKRI
ncbi:hypothetical protein HK096_003725 [Nowakowskiella sp. JEL0078]|nr:hypothetical protein HK096_003725 [Nowakowskiella sp. JEL0078]